MKKDILLTKIFLNLAATGAVEDLKDFSDKLDRNYCTISSALNGREQYLTEKLYRRVMQVFPQVNPVFVRTGRGDVLREIQTPAAAVPVISKEAQNRNLAEMLEKLLMSQKGDLELTWSTEGGQKTTISVSQLQATA